MSPFGTVPLLVLTGFVGAGRTTLLARWLAEPGFADTGVVANDLGELTIDAHLLGGYRGTLRAVTGGCACCTASERFLAALESLALERRRRGHAGGRVMVETAGLADPASILERVARLPDEYALHGIVAVVDAVEGVHWLEARCEARAQAIAADAIVVTRADLASGAGIAALRAELARLNPDAAIFTSEGVCDPHEVWNAVAAAPERELRHLRAVLEGRGADTDSAESDALQAHTLRLDAPVELSGFCVRLAAFLDEQGANVLRVKGLVAAQGRRGPAVIQALSRSLQPVRTLRKWPGGVESGLVVVGRDLEPQALRALAHSGALAGKA